MIQNSIKFVVFFPEFQY